MLILFSILFWCKYLQQIKQRIQFCKRDFSDLPTLLFSQLFPLMGQWDLTQPKFLRGPQVKSKWDNLPAWNGWLPITAAILELKIRDNIQSILPFTWLPCDNQLCSLLIYMYQYNDGVKYNKPCNLVMAHLIHT